MGNWVQHVGLDSCDGLKCRHRIFLKAGRVISSSAELVEFLARAATYRTD